MDALSSQAVTDMVDSLKKQSKKARGIRNTLMTALVLAAFALIVIISVRLLNAPGITQLPFAPVAPATGSYTDNAALITAISRQAQLLSPVVAGEEKRGAIKNGAEPQITSEKTKPGGANASLTDAQRKQAMEQLDKLVDNYVKIAQSLNSRPVIKTDNTWSNMISALLIAAGAVGFIAYILQIMVGFLRYYARLAELYDTQAAIMEASEGKVDRIKEMMTVLSSKHIGLGKEPEMIYSKLAEALSEKANSKTA